MVTHLDAVTITVMLTLVDMVSLTSVLFKECLHRAIWSRTLSFLLLIYSCFHAGTFSKIALILRVKYI